MNGFAAPAESCSLVCVSLMNHRMHRITYLYSSMMVSRLRRLVAVKTSNEWATYSLWAEFVERPNEHLLALHICDQVVQI
jgi:hypothetical protein